MIYNSYFIARLREFSDDSVFLSQQNQVKQLHFQILRACIEKHVTNATRDVFENAESVE